MAKRDAREYLGCGPFDKNAFRAAYAAEFGGVPKYNSASVPDLIFSQYFHGSHTDYVHARAMVNGHSGEREVADIAERFERALFASKLKPRVGAAT